MVADWDGVVSDGVVVDGFVDCVFEGVIVVVVEGVVVEGSLVVEGEVDGFGVLVPGVLLPNTPIFMETVAALLSIVPSFTENRNESCPVKLFLGVYVT